jgi:hypothetical protein
MAQCTFFRSKDICFSMNLAVFRSNLAQESFNMPGGLSVENVLCA